MNYYHVDVFTSNPLSGNGLTVIFHKDNLDKLYMQRLAQEFKQFETIFLQNTGEKSFRARIFTVEEELDFAGHPILGAVSTIHEQFYSDEDKITIQLQLNCKILESESIKKNGYYEATMNQGVPEYLGVVDKELSHIYLEALNLTEDNLYELPMEVISCGLPYLIVPLANGLDQANICINDLEEQLSKVYAKFVYVFDIAKMEGRTWDNFGTVEDVATGSAAGPVGAYLHKWNIWNTTEEMIVNQGRFVGRPSKIKVNSNPSTGEVFVSGDVKIIAKGELL